MPRVALDRVQRWMQAVIVHPGTVDEGIRSRGAAAEFATVEEVVRPSARLTAAERVGIYHGMYLGRMVEALESDYPALQRLLGRQGFADLVRGYIQAHPSRSYTLNRLGDHLPEFVAKAPGLRQRGFCHDLARLELAMSQVFDEEETPALTPEAIAAVPRRMGRRPSPSHRRLPPPGRPISRERVRGCDPRRGPRGPATRGGGRAA